jgi:predicted phosphodiesterase
MRIAVLSDVHGNLSALEAVIADLRVTRPDLVVHAGDLVSGGPRPADVIDRIREMNWPGVYGNTDEMLWKPHRVSETLSLPPLQRTRDLLLTHTIPVTLAAIGHGRLAWLRALPRRWCAAGVTVVHAVPDDVWPAVPADTPDEHMDQVYSPLGTHVVVYGHIHQPFVRTLPALTVANSGSVGLPFDGDPRASYAIADGDRVTIRRVAYDAAEEIRLLSAIGDPFAPETAETLRTGRPPR